MMRSEIALGFVLVCASVAFGQACCGIGSSRSSGSYAQIGNRGIYAATGLEWSRSGHQYSGNVRTVDPINRRLHRFEYRLEAGYGITDRLSAILGTTFQWRTKAFDIPDPFGGPRIGFDELNSGLGDGVLTLKYALVPFTLLNPAEVVVGMTATMPWGPTDHSNNGVLYPRDMQTGSGAWAAGLLFHTHRSWPGKYSGVSATTTFQVHGEDGRGVRAGSQANATIIGHAGPWGPARMSLGGNIRVADTDKNQGSTNPGTGGLWLYAIPGIEVATFQALTFTMESELPVWRRVNGSQLSTGLLVRAGINYLH